MTLTPAGLPERFRQAVPVIQGNHFQSLTP